MSGDEPPIRRRAIPTDSVSLVIIGLIAVVVFWLVFSLVRKVFGLLLLVAVAAGAWFLWSNPELLQSVLNGAASFAGWD